MNSFFGYLKKMLLWILGSFLFFNLIYFILNNSYGNKDFPMMIIRQTLIFVFVSGLKNCLLEGAIVKNKNWFIKMFIIIFPSIFLYLIYEPNIKEVNAIYDTYRYFGIYTRLDNGMRLLDNLVLMDLIVSIAIIIICKLTIKNKKQKHLIFAGELFLKNSISLFCLIEMFYAYSKMMIPNESKTIYYVFMLVPSVIIGIYSIYGVVLIDYAREIKKIQENFKQNLYDDKTLIIYHTPQNMGIEIKPESYSSNIDNFLGNFLAKSRNTYFVETSNEIAVSYGMIYNNIIDETKFKKIIYLFYLSDFCEYEIDRTYINVFLKRLDYVIENKKDYLVVNTSKTEKSKLIKIIKEKCKSRYEMLIGNEARKWYKILMGKDEYIENKVTDILKKLNNFSQLDFVKKSLIQIKEGKNSIEKLYILSKCCEYMIHYEALYNLSITEGSILKSNSPSVGTWNDIKSTQAKVCDDANVRKYIQRLDQILNTKSKTTNLPKKITNKTIKDRIVSVKNKYLGHGSVSYYVSKELVDSLMPLAQILIENFAEEELNLEGKKITDRYNDELLAMIEKEGKKYFYSCQKGGTVEYLCYETGEILKVLKPNAKPFELNLGGRYGKN